MQDAALRSAAMPGQTRTALSGLRGIAVGQPLAAAAMMRARMTDDRGQSDCFPGGCPAISPRTYHPVVREIENHQTNQGQSVDGHGSPERTWCAGSVQCADPELPCVGKC